MRCCAWVCRLYGANQLAIDRIGPTVILLGTEQQKERYLAKMLTGEEIWCQGYSEPNSGSDLASLQTRAVLDGDSFVVNGQKVWTSLAQRADMQVLLVRTDPSAPKHKGISYLLVDMKSPGMTVRPLMQITGESGFNEVFYDNVRVPKENLVGEINQGWQVSIATLMWERASGGTRHPVERTINELIELAKAIEFEGIPAFRHPYIRQKLSHFAIESRCLRLSRYRGLTAQLKGKVPGTGDFFRQTVRDRTEPSRGDVRGRTARPVRNANEGIDRRGRGWPMGDADAGGARTDDRGRL